jgi:ammonia channel protein AmtB
VEPSKSLRLKPLSATACQHFCEALVHACRYGVNPGSALAILGNSSVAALAAVNTTISGSAATLTALGVSMFRSYRESGVATWDLLVSANGTLGGLVAITAGACTLLYSMQHS